MLARRIPVHRARQYNLGQSHKLTKTFSSKPGKHGVPKKDPAHAYWNESDQGFWDLIRFGREAYWGVKGYTKSHFIAPPEVSIDAVLNDPARADWDEELREMGNKYPKFAFLSEQWRLQNQSQALGGNPLPVVAGEKMIEGLVKMGEATTLKDKLAGHYHAQINSLGGEGFQGGASYLMHVLAFPVQWPTIILRHNAEKYGFIDPNQYPVRTFTRKAYAKANANWEWVKSKFTEENE